MTATWFAGFSLGGCDSDSDAISILPNSVGNFVFIWSRLLDKHFSPLGKMQQQLSADFRLPVSLARVRKGYVEPMAGRDSLYRRILSVLRDAVATPSSPGMSATLRYLVMGYETVERVAEILILRNYDAQTGTVTTVDEGCEWPEMAKMLGVNIVWPDWREASTRTVLPHPTMFLSDAVLLLRSAISVSMFTAIPTDPEDRRALARCIRADPSLVDTTMIDTLSPLQRIASHLADLIELADISASERDLSPTVGDVMSVIKRRSMFKMHEVPQFLPGTVEEEMYKHDAGTYISMHRELYRSVHPEITSSFDPVFVDLFVTSIAKQVQAGACTMASLAPFDLLQMIRWNASTSTVLRNMEHLVIDWSLADERDQPTPSLQIRNVVTRIMISGICYANVATDYFDFHINRLLDLVDYEAIDKSYRSVALRSRVVNGRKVGTRASAAVLTEPYRVWLSYQLILQQFILYSHYVIRGVKYGNMELVQKGATLLATLFTNHRMQRALQLVWRKGLVKDGLRLPSGSTLGRVVYLRLMKSLQRVSALASLLNDDIEHLFPLVSNMASEGVEPSGDAKTMVLTKQGLMRAADQVMDSVIVADAMFGRHVPPDKDIFHEGDMWTVASWSYRAHPWGHTPLLAAKHLPPGVPTRFTAFPMFTWNSCLYDPVRKLTYLCTEDEPDHAVAHSMTPTGSAAASDDKSTGNIRKLVRRMIGTYYASDKRLMEDVRRDIQDVVKLYQAPLSAMIVSVSKIIFWWRRIVRRCRFHAWTFVCVPERVNLMGCIFEEIAGHLMEDTASPAGPTISIPTQICSLTGLYDKECLTESRPIVGSQTGTSSFREYFNKSMRAHPSSSGEQLVKALLRWIPSHRHVPSGVQAYLDTHRDVGTTVRRSVVGLHEPLISVGDSPIFTMPHLSTKSPVFEVYRRLFQFRSPVLSSREIPAPEI